MFCCPACLRSRRTFLAADMPSADAPAPAAPASCWIDVHCHVFNAIDLPMSQFIDKTRLSSKLDLPIWVLVAILTGGLQQAAPSASAEAALLDTQDALPPAPPKHDLETALRAISAPPDGSGASHRFAPPPANGNEVLREALGLPADDNAPLTDAQYKQLADHLQSDGALGTVLGWANDFSLPRNKLIDRLLLQFAGAPNVMLTPALVDYNRWLDIADGGPTEQAMTSMENQLMVMAAIARWRAREQGVPVFAFAAFDPWRYLEDKSKHRPTMLDIGARYIEDGSIIGFKLYPPMGFAPMGNADQPDDWFPPALCKLVGAHVGAALDQAMDDLFAYCVAQDVPVMAHCASSEFPTGADDKAPHCRAWGADPTYWDQALAKYPTLRVNLGHFGGIWDFGASVRPALLDEDRKNNQKAEDLAQGWARKIVAMMQNEAYPNLYADVAFANNLLVAKGDPEEQRTWSFLHDMLTGNAMLGKRLMYGSDWEMVGQVVGGKDYASLLMRNVADLFPDGAIEDFRWRNAAHFLGLGAGDKTRARLEKFRADNAIVADMFAPFDPASA